MASNIGLPEGMTADDAYVAGVSDAEQRIARDLDAIAQKWDDKRREFWVTKEQFDVDAQVAAQNGEVREWRRYEFNSAKYERLAAVAKEASNDAYELAAQVRGLLVKES